MWRDVTAHVTVLGIQPVDGTAVVLGWLGLTLLILAVIVRLLDWGPLSPRPPTRWPPRSTARALVIAGTALLMVAALVGVLRA
jgi:hypothetical protein